MNILFLGDSITEGVPGVSYVSMIDRNCQKLEVVNRGKGGDTVSSLLKRVKKMDDLSSFDQIVLFIGVNDVFGKLTTSYKLLKTITNQRWAKDSATFSMQYHELLTTITKENKNVIIIPPLLVGEDSTNRWNIELVGLIDSIKLLANTFYLTFIPLDNEFRAYLANKDVSGYLPIKIRELLHDVKTLTTSQLVDQTSENRGLHLTLDGVHLNSTGASIISNAVIKALNCRI